MRAPAVHRAAHDTEIEAARSVAPTAARLRSLVLGLLVDHPDGLTDDEGGYFLGEVVPRADRLTFGRRRHELVQEGLVEDSGKWRYSESGRRAIVWRLKPLLVDPVQEALPL